MNPIKALENLGYHFQLAIDYKEPDNPPPEAEALLVALASERDTIIRDMAGRLIATEQGLYEAPPDIPVPAPWEIQRLAQIIWEEAQGGKDLQKIHDAAATIWLHAANDPNAHQMHSLFQWLHM